MDEVLQEFAGESLELAADVERDLLALESDPRSLDLLNRIFRAFHTIKGGAGFMSVTPLVDACHLTESLFDALRQGSLQVNGPLITTALEATQYVIDSLRRLADGEAIDNLPRLSAAMARDLQSLIDGVSTNAAPQSHPPSAASARAPSAGGQISGETIDWSLYYRAVLESIDDDAGMDEAGLEALSVSAAIAPREGAAVERSAEVKTEHRDETLRVKSTKLDELLEVAGESVQAASQAAALFEKIQSFQLPQEVTPLLSALAETLQRASRFTAELQRATLSTRMQPVGRLFQKFPRLVRDLSSELNKRVELQISGAETEVDRVVVDSLYDPMVHMMRNALDHGVEPADQRMASGKPVVSTIRLAAWQEGGSVVIEVADDGAGIDPEAIRRKAIQRGLIRPHEAESRDEALQLVFLPGFSTKETASAVSGRGVGMDVVRTMVEKHRGTIQIRSEVGKGTCFSIRLPIEMSIVPTMLVRAGGLLMGIPMSAVERVLRIPETLHQVMGQPIYRDQGRPLPVRSLAESLGYPAHEERLGIVVASSQPHILSVSSVEGTADLVIKPLTALESPGIAGTARSPEAEIVLVISLDFLFKHVQQSAPARRASDADLALEAAGAEPSTHSSTSAAPNPLAQSNSNKGESWELF